MTPRGSFILALAATAALAAVQGACDVDIDSDYDWGSDEQPAAGAGPLDVFSTRARSQAPADKLPIPVTAKERALEVAEKKEEETYQEKLVKIAKSARKSVEQTHKLFVLEVAKLFVNPPPFGKGTLQNLSGIVQGTYVVNDGGYSVPTLGLTCGSRLLSRVNCTSWMEEPNVPQDDARVRCNEVGSRCSGYGCVSAAAGSSSVVCYPCSGLDELAINGTDFKPFFAKKSPDHLEYDRIVNKSRAWARYFKNMQAVAEDTMEDEARAVEDQFTAQEAKVALIGAQSTTGKWRKREEDAWRSEEYKEANWYAKKMKLEIAKIDGFHNKVLAKLTNDVNIINNMTFGTHSTALTNSIRPSELAQHKSADDCWAAIASTVYDFTYVTKIHQAAAINVIPYCGKVITDKWNKFHGVSNLPKMDRVRGTLVGARGSLTETTATAPAGDDSLAQAKAASAAESAPSDESAAQETEEVEEVSDEPGPQVDPNDPMGFDSGMDEQPVHGYRHIREHAEVESLLADVAPHAFGGDQASGSYRHLMRRDRK